MKISVIGAGYVGLTTAACLAHVGHHVFCSESDSLKLYKLQNGEMPLFEPHLEEIVGVTRRSGRLTFGSTAEAIDWGEVIFMCVGTPPLDNGEADLAGIERVARAIAKQATGYRLIIEKSTVPVQTGAQLRKYMSVHNTNGLEYDIASNPEFLREGSAVSDFLHPERIVLGVTSTRASVILRELYHPIMERTFLCPVHAECTSTKRASLVECDTNSAEMIKHASNSFLATKISFINMIADLCEAAGADIIKVAEGIGLDPRIGSSFLQPGIGFGGFCFPKDLQAFVRIAEKFGCDFALLKEVERINYDRVGRFIQQVKKELWVLRGKRVAVWGLSFKPDTDDIRFAPALAIVRQLLAEGASIQAYDPQAMDKCREELSQVVYCEDVYQAAEGAEAILLLTEWNEFLNVDWERLRTLVERPLVLDGRNALDGEEVAAHGFQYQGVGGKSLVPLRARVPAVV